MQAHAPVRVIKLGGSLLELGDLRQRLYSWLEKQTPSRNLIVTGGGKTVESIRELDAIHRLPCKFTHWLCVDVMAVTAKLASEILGLDPPLANPVELNEFLTHHFEHPTLACIQPDAYYTPSIAQQSGCALPESWDCTSDSISAWLARSLGADELVLLKSIESASSPACGLSPDAIRALADCNAVDPVFPNACQQVPNVRIVNLRKVACDS